MNSRRPSTICAPSHVLWQLAAIDAYGPLTPEELARFAPHTRERIQRLAKGAR
jgi:hypothetical protein